MYFLSALFLRLRGNPYSLHMIPIVCIIRVTFISNLQKCSLLERIYNIPIYICIYFFKLSDEADKKSTEKITTPYMTKYERARVLGTRALQIGKNFCLE